MSLVESLLGYRGFSSEPEIRESIAKSQYYDSSKESPDNAGSLLIFETARQHTWLVATAERLYFILDDVRKPGSRIGRSVRRDELKTLPDGSVAVNTQPKSVHTGLVDVGLRRRGWLYSKRLFSSDRPIECAVNELLAAAGVRAFTDQGIGRTRTGAALLRRGLFRLFIGVCARGRSSSVRLARGQRPHPPLFGQPARPDHGV